jgi:hypothetical protein
MKSRSNICALIVTGLALFNMLACSRRTEQKDSQNASQPASAPTQAPPAQNAPATPNTAAQNGQTQATGAGLEAAATAAPQTAHPPDQGDQAAAPPPVPKLRTFRLAAGTRINVRTLGSMSTKTLKTGDSFQGTLSVPLVVHGVVIAPKGAGAMGVVAKSDPGGRVKGVASLTLQVLAIRSADGQTIHVQTTPFVQDAKNTKKRDGVRTGVAGGAGALIGAIAGGGKGAAIGAGVGGGAGVATNLATRGAPAELPAESVLVFTLTQSSGVTEIHPGSLDKTSQQSSAEAGSPSGPRPE